MTDPTTAGSRAPLPGSLTTAAIVSLVFASLGLTGACFGLLGASMQTQNLANFRALGAGADPEAATMLEPMIALQEQIFVPSIATQVLSGIAACLLLVAGILVLVRNRAAPTLGPGLFLGSAIASILATLGDFWIQRVSMHAMEGMMMSAAPPDPAFAATISPLMAYGAALTYGCAGGWLLAKISFIAWAALHLRQPEHVQYFERAAVLGPRGE